MKTKMPHEKMEKSNEKYMKSKNETTKTKEKHENKNEKMKSKNKTGKTRKNNENFRSLKNCNFPRFFSLFFFVFRCFVAETSRNEKRTKLKENCNF